MMGSPHQVMAVLQRACLQAHPLWASAARAHSFVQRAPTKNGVGNVAEALDQPQKFATAKTMIAMGKVIKRSCALGLQCARQASVYQSVEVASFPAPWIAHAKQGSAYATPASM